jgi:UPF0755 protein
VRKVGIVLLSLATVAVAAGIYLNSWINDKGEPTGLPVTVSIKEGTSAASIANTLQNQRVIDSALAFRLYLRTQDVGSELKAGKYKLRTDLPFATILSELRKGPDIEYTKLVIPEGLNIEQTAAQVERLTNISAADFKAALAAPTRRPSILPAGVNSLEGFLYPTTYFVDPTKETAATLVARMVSQFEQEMGKVNMEQGAGALGLNPYQVLVLASLVEEEAKVDEERSKISAVIHNRLRRSMPLGIDATIQYAVGKYNARDLTVSDLAVNSPYNTRLNPGLPPGPISSPRASSVLAALKPTQSEDLYFVLTKDCVHHAFTPNYSEFLTAKSAQPATCG